MVVIHEWSWYAVRMVLGGLRRGNVFFKEAVIREWPFCPVLVVLGGERVD